MVMRLFAIAVGAAIIAANPVAGTAQQLPGSTQNYYVDGRTPVDQHTMGLVDAYVIYQEQLDREEAERREAFQLHIYQDRASATTPYGRY